MVRNSWWWGWFLLWQQWGGQERGSPVLFNTGVQPMGFTFRVDLSPHYISLKTLFTHKSRGVSPRLFQIQWNWQWRLNIRGSKSNFFGYAWLLYKDMAFLCQMELASSLLKWRAKCYWMPNNLDVLYHENEIRTFWVNKAFSCTGQLGLKNQQVMEQL